MEGEFINRVSESALITLDLADYYPQTNIAVFDLKDFLFMGLILKEKDFREALKNLDLTNYQEKDVAVTCSADAVIPMWAYMLVAGYLQPVARSVTFGTEAQLREQLLLRNLDRLPVPQFADQRVVIKGCGELPIGEAAYLKVTAMLRPVVKSIMYGEPCSTVPIFKRK